MCVCECVCVCASVSVLVIVSLSKETRGKLAKYKSRYFKTSNFRQKQKFFLSTYYQFVNTLNCLSVIIPFFVHLYLLFCWPSSIIFQLDLLLLLFQFHQITRYQSMKLNFTRLWLVYFCLVLFCLSLNCFAGFQFDFDSGNLNTLACNLILFNKIACFFCSLFSCCCCCCCLCCCLCCCCCCCCCCGCDYCGSRVSAATY